MQKNRYIIFILTILLSLTSVSAECFFDSNNQNCSSFGTPFNLFTVDFNDIADLHKYDAKLYMKANPSNLIKLEVEGNEIRNINPFVEPGVYVLEINALNFAQVNFNKKFDFVFDNTKPQSPVIPTNLISDSSSIEIIGKTNPSNQILALDSSSNLYRATIDINGNYNLNIPLNSGLNFYNFYTIKNTQGTEYYSEPTQRVIFSETDFKETNQNEVSNIQIEDNLQIFNERTTRSNNDYITAKRNFYVQGKLSGSNLKGSLVYVNGIRTLSDSNGNFGTFVPLNVGQNNIVIKSKHVETSLNIEYKDYSFLFLSYNFDKVTDSNTLQFNAKTNFDLPVSIYLNGKYIETNRPVNGNLDYTFSNFKPGINYILLEGFNNQRVMETFYYDQEVAQVTTLTNDQIAESNFVVFEIKDDVGIDTNSLDVTFSNGFTFTGDSIEFEGDYYYVDISDFPPGDLTYSITGEDLSGKSFSHTGSLTIDELATVFEKIDSDDGSLIGNKLFVNEMSTTLTLKPSRHISFNKIYLDGVEITNYEIKENGDVEVKLDFTKSTGILDISYINNEYQSFSQVLNYYTDLEKPEVSLDYIINPYANSQNFVKITGKITDANFDWSTLNINGENNFLRFGDYFEAYVKMYNNSDSNLEISGFDYSLNPFSKTSFGNVLSYDDSETSVSLNEFNKNGIIGNLINNENKIKHFATEYDSMNLQSIFIPQSFELASSDRQGLRAINLKVQEKSNEGLSSNGMFSVDDSNPEIYFEKVGSEILRVLVDGTFSPVNEDSLLVLIADSDVTVLTTSCSGYEKISVNDFCFEVPFNYADSLELTIEDSSGNQINRIFDNNFESKPKQDFDLDFFFNGNDYKTLNSDHFIQGNIISSSPITSVTVEGGDCSFDENSFGCEISLPPGSTDFEVVVRNQDGEVKSKTITYELLEDDVEVSILDIYPSAGIYKVDESYFLTIDAEKINALGNVESDSVISAIIDGREILLGKQEGNFTFSVDITDQLQGKESDQFELKLKAQDESGRVGFSASSISFLYTRIMETLVDVFLN